MSNFDQSTRPGRDVEKQQGEGVVLNVCEKLVVQQMINKEQLKKRSRVGWLGKRRKRTERLGSGLRASCLNLAEQWLEMRKLGKGPDMLKEVDMLRKEKSKMENRQAMKVDKPLAFVYLL